MRALIVFAAWPAGLLLLLIYVVSMIAAERRIVAWIMEMEP